MRARSGLTMVELMVAMTILSVVLLSMSGLFVIVSRRSKTNDNDLRRAAFIAQTVNFLAATPFDSLPAKVKTDSVKFGGTWFKREITVADSGTSGTRRMVTVSVYPRATTRKETVRFFKTKPQCTSVLNTVAGGC